MSKLHNCMWRDLIKSSLRLAFSSAFFYLKGNLLHFYCLDLGCPHIGRTMRKYVFEYRRTARALIRLRIRAVWSRPSLSANRIIRHCRMWKWRANARIRLCAGAGWSESAHCVRVWKHVFTWHFSCLSGNLRQRSFQHVRPIKTQPRSLISLFVRRKKLYILGCFKLHPVKILLSANAQTELNLRWAHVCKYGSWRCGLFVSVRYVGQLSKKDSCIRPSRWNFSKVINP